jgi:hypothetical protein
MIRIRTIALLAVLLVPVRAWAGPEEDAAALYGKATELTRAGRCEEAIPLLERSYAMVESPNSVLLLARCMRDGGRLEEAYRRYETALEKAEARVALGELRYSATATSAREELTALRKRSGTVVIKGIGASQHIEVHGMRVEPQGDGSARVRVRKGTANVKLVEGDRTVRERAVDVKVDQTVEISLAGPKPEATATVPAPAAVTAPTPETPSSSWLMPATIGAGAVGVVGFGAFAFFGLRSQSVYSSLEQCSPTCPPDRQAEADRGSREQTIANIGLVVGIVGAVACVSLIIAGATSSPKNAARAFSF